jgi:hypothetical protein
MTRRRGERQSDGYRAVEVELGARLAPAAHLDHDEVLGYGRGATEMAVDGKAGTVALGGRQGGRRRPLINPEGETQHQRAR